jgi:predicted nucleic acid-binding protein
VIHADTSFLVDLLRDAARGVRGPATALLEEIEREEIRVGVHVVCELLAGAGCSQRPAIERHRVRRLCGNLVVSYPDERFAPVYATLLASLRGVGRPIATMDLLIATSAIVDAAAIVTRNTRHFSRVPGLEVRGY